MTRNSNNNNNYNDNIDVYFNSREMVLHIDEYKL